MKITVLVGTLSIGGAEKVAVNLANGFADRGYETDLVVLKDEGPLASNLDEKVTLNPLYASRVRWSLPSIIRYLNRRRPDVVISVMTVENALTVLSAKISRYQPMVIVTEHSVRSDRTWKSVAFKGDFLLGMATYNKSDEIVAVSDSVARDVLSWSNVSRKDITVIHNPVELASPVNNTDEVSCSVTEQHEWFSLNEPVLLAAGRYTPEKDFSTLIRAFSKVSERIRGRLMILGDGEQRNELETLSKELAVKDRVCLYGFVDDPYPYMKAADLFVLSSRSEGFGNVLVEAMSCGTPVVATKCGSGPVTILDDGTYGPLIPVGNVSQMAKTILETLSDPPDSEVLRDRAQDFSVETIVSQYLELIDAKLTQRGV
ncbi:glycosyltransferase [Natrarchaeobius oligotrophus]|uniref:Glycosyltransferase n=1 Tax=Natrarchaeobius chitinivorans TaxID=1679083 RepID=A0A3N6M4L7_NATCH|nr:glycosyltransferase [Natrarchaeobius chitinivorans]RQG96957.1 glycosyltransferase [Natrarchaeobius chitinivorans]